MTSSEKLNQIRDVDIDPSGKFKYILIKVTDPETKEEKYIVRGYKSCAYHINIFESVEPSITKLKCKAKCVGGGRILHKPEVKSIFIYGYSQGFGRADHAIAEKLIKEKYSDYTDISWSNEGY
uniref:Sex-regulated protein janus-B n=1 Tax=Aceria tosichella TaxID=561515 RepID=A0A6G1SPT5_9ACAR